MQAGLDSLAAVDLRNAIAARFGLSVAPTLAFDYPTLAAMSQHLVQRLDHRPADVQPSSMAAASEPAMLRSEVLAVGCRYPGSDDGEALHLLLASPCAVHTPAVSLLVLAARPTVEKLMSHAEWVAQSHVSQFMLTLQRCRRARLLEGSSAAGDPAAAHSAAALGPCGSI